MKERATMTEKQKFDKQQQTIERLLLKHTKELAIFVRMCFGVMQDEDLEDLREISNRAQLSVSTLNRLRNETFTSRVRFWTIQKLGMAAGLSLSLTDKGAKVSLVKGKR